MWRTVLAVQVALASSPICLAFRAPIAPFRTPTSIFALMEVELLPEPTDGVEVSAKSSMPDSRVKEMKVIDDTKFEFWMTAQADGALIQEIKTQVLKDASKKANFPGFRKGQVPPYAMPQIVGFAVQESIIKTVEAVVEAYGLKSLPGSEGEVTVKEDVADMAKRYKSGMTIPFTATLKAAYASQEVESEA